MEAAKRKASVARGRRYQVRLYPATRFHPTTKLFFISHSIRHTRTRTSGAINFQYSSLLTPITEIFRCPPPHLWDRIEAPKSQKPLELRLRHRKPVFLFLFAKISIFFSFSYYELFVLLTSIDFSLPSLDGSAPTENENCYENENQLIDRSRSFFVSFGEILSAGFDFLLTSTIIIFFVFFFSLSPQSKSNINKRRKKSQQSTARSLRS
jgi:hypothetical protein